MSLSPQLELILRDWQRTSWQDVLIKVHQGWGRIGAMDRPEAYVISDETRVLASEPARLLRLQARAWPAGEATVEIAIEPDGSGSRVTMREAPSAGPGKWLDNPLARLVLRERNAESLRRLKARGGPSRAARIGAS